MKWIFERAITLYAFAAAVFIVIIWVIGECRQYIRKHSRTFMHGFKLLFKCKSQSMKLDKDAVAKLNS